MPRAPAGKRDRSRAERACFEPRERIGQLLGGAARRRGGIVQLVRDAGGKRAERRHLLRLAQRPFGLFLPGDVGAEAEDEAGVRVVAMLEDEFAVADPGLDRDDRPLVARMPCQVSGVMPGQVSRQLLPISLSPNTARAAAFARSRMAS